MTDENKVDITLILDESPSMTPIWDATIKGVNQLLEDQRREMGEKKATFTLVKFDSAVKEGFAQDLSSFENINRGSYRPGGSGTALWDAIGKTIELTGKRLKALKESERPSRVIVVIYTDGEENSSRTYTSAQVKTMIEHQREKFNWDFIFLGAELNAYLIGRSLGININLNVARSVGSTRAAWASTSDLVSSKMFKAPTLSASMGLNYTAKDYGTQASYGAQDQSADPAVKAALQDAFKAAK